MRLSRRLSDALSRFGATVRRAVGRAARVLVGCAHALGGSVRAAIRISSSKTRRWSRVAVALYAAACSRAETPTSSSHVGLSSEMSEPMETPAPIASVAELEEPVDRPLGNFLLTLYHVADEVEVAALPPKKQKKAKGAANDNETVDNVVGDAEVALAAAVPDLVPIYDRTCETLGNVSRAFAAQLALQGTGRLRDGRLLNVAGKCTCPRTPCFHVLPPHRKWGMGGSGQPLEPFRTVAVDPKRIKLGSLLYVPVLDGLRMPGRAPVGGFIHDGCVVAGDTGGGIQGAQLDLFVARRAYVQGLARRGGSHSWMKSVPVFDGSNRCVRKGGKVSRSAAGSI